MAGAAPDDGLTRTARRRPEPASDNHRRWPPARVSPSVFPLGSRLNERGRLEVGGCDTIELAREFGTPAYVVAEDDLRARARAFMRAGRDAGHEDFHVVFASKAFPCTAVLRVFAQEGLWCDVASGGELHLALEAGFRPKRLVLHGNAKSETELGMALGLGVGLIVMDNFDEIDRLEGLLAERGGAAQRVLVRVTPDVRGETHEKISTGQADSKFGFAMAQVPEAIARVRGGRGAEARGGARAHRLAAARAGAVPATRWPSLPAWATSRCGTWAAAWACATPRISAEPPAIEEYVAAIVRAAHAHGMGADRRLLIEPGRSLSANACVTLYTVESVKHNVSRWVAVDGGMSDNLRPMLYGAAL